jgi:hypothetical protein
MVTMGACMIKDYGIAKHALFSYTHQLITASTASAVVRYCVLVPRHTHRKDRKSAQNAIEG